MLTERFSQIPALRVSHPGPENVIHSYYKYYVFLRTKRLGAAGPASASSRRSMLKACHAL